MRVPPATHLVILCHGRPKAEAALAALRELLAGLGLALSDHKTRIVCADGEGFDFLGYHQRMVRSHRERGVRYLARWPSEHAVAAARARVRELTARRRARVATPTIVRELNSFLRGWGAYFRHGQSSTQLRKIDNYAIERLGRLVGVKHGVRRPIRDGSRLLLRRDKLGLRPIAGTAAGRARTPLGQERRRAV